TLPRDLSEQPDVREALRPAERVRAQQRHEEGGLRPTRVRPPSKESLALPALVPFSAPARPRVALRHDPRRGPRCTAPDRTAVERRTEHEHRRIELRVRKHAGPPSALRSTAIHLGGEPSDANREPVHQGVSPTGAEPLRRARTTSD